MHAFVKESYHNGRHPHHSHLAHQLPGKLEVEL